MIFKYLFIKWPEYRKLFFWRSGFLVLTLCTAACSSPAQRIDTVAAEYGLQRRVILGDAFRHITYLKIAQPSSGRLHVYIEGDGRPWLFGRYIAEDPTTERPLALELANLDSENVLYLGRPCYMGLQQDGMCEEKYWTSARFSPAVVASMLAAVRRVVDELDINNVSLIGYSGGGSLAMLMASDVFSSAISELDVVVTISANLDVAAWTTQHGYLPLNESLDPMLAMYSNSVNYLHYSGAADDNVPSRQLLNFVAAHGGQYKILDAVDHSCCWLQLWPELLKQDVSPLERHADDRRR